MHTETKLTRFTKDGKAHHAHFLQNGARRRVTAEVVFKALGRRPDLAGLDLEKAGVQTRGGRIGVNRWMQTSASRIYAAGRLCGTSRDRPHCRAAGEIAGHNATAGGREKRMDDRLLAQVVFTDPQVASVGLSERDCRRLDVDYEAASYPFEEHGKSMILGETLGFAKLLCEPRGGKLLGAHIVGPEASELIHEMIAVMYFRGSVNDILQMPTTTPPSRKFSPTRRKNSPHESTVGGRTLYLSSTHLKIWACQVA